jgi:thymidylate synthase (FAD)
MTTIGVDLIRHTGSDVDIARAAWVSTKGEAAETHTDTARVAGLVNYLMRQKHGTPFEHNSMTFRVHAPIFVWREHMRHRIGVSYNEESGRYSQLEPVFYVPMFSRTQHGKPGAYTMEPGSTDQTMLMLTAMRSSSTHAYREYEIMLQAGIAREVARMVLPVNIYSSAYVTFNVRSLLHFLELRLAATAQQEIREVAEQYLDHFGALFPATAASFIHNGRVAP